MKVEADLLNVTFGIFWVIKLKESKNIERKTTKVDEFSRVLTNLLGFRMVVVNRNYNFNGGRLIAARRSCYHRNFCDMKYSAGLWFLTPQLYLIFVCPSHLDVIPPLKCTSCELSPDFKD